MTEAVVTTVSHLIGVPPKEHLASSSTSRIVQLLEKQVSLSLQDNDEVRVIKSNLAVHGIHYSPPVADDTNTGIGFAIWSSSSNAFTDNSTELFYGEDTIKVKQPSSSISFSSHNVKNFIGKMSSTLLLCDLFVDKKGSHRSGS